jgi:lantibiotic modifying enzyme
LINCQKCQKTSCAKQVAKQKLTVLTCTAYKAKKTNMKTCPNCGKVEGGHSSILQGCMCQYSMQAPPQPKQEEHMKYEDIKYFSQRCEEHPDHQSGMISNSMLQQRLHEEIDELREYIEQLQGEKHMKK